MNDSPFQRYFLKKIDFLVLIGFATVFLGFLQGCSSQSDAAWKTMQLGFRNEAAQIEKAPLKNNLTYFRANINGFDVLLVKGYVDSNPNGPIDVWYSSDRSVLRIQQGRYLGSIGFDQNWYEVSRSNAPSFDFLLNTEMSSSSKTSTSAIRNTKKYFSSQSYVVMPSYQVMREERISSVVFAFNPPSNLSLTAPLTSVLATPSIPETIPSSFKKYLLNKELIWVSETPQPNDIFKKKGASFAWYGFVKSNAGFTQVIGQQCLSKEFCITWTPWPVQP